MFFAAVLNGAKWHFGRSKLLLFMDENRGRVERVEWFSMGIEK